MPRLTDIELEIPLRSGEVFCVPSAREFVTLAQRNAQGLAGTAATINGIPLPEVRRRARQESFQTASVFSRELGIDVPALSHEPLLLVTGHQPFLFHPGIWIKHLLIDRLAGGEVVALSVPVDSDAVEETVVDVPHLDADPSTALGAGPSTPLRAGPSAPLRAGLRMEREVLLQVPDDVTYETQAPPSTGTWVDFLRRIRGHLQTLPVAEVRDTFDEFARLAADLRGPEDFATFMTMARRRYEGLRRYLELPVSRLVRGPAFRQFVVHILRHAERFAELYNRHLDEHRKRHGIRTAAQPFPNLEVERARIELPFWIVQGGRRQPLYVEPVQGGWRLWAAGAAVGTVRNDQAVEDVAALPVRPRALTLTAFTRLCVADLFVHGVGGGRYDRVTDAVIREFFGLEPPAYAVVTATLHLPLAEYDVAEQRRRTQRQLLDLQHNPERTLSFRQAAGPQVPAALQALIDEKWRLIAALDGTEMMRRERRTATRRIREINEQLARALDEERRVLERRVAALEHAGDSEAATHREYPYCFFPPRAMDKLVDAMLTGA